MQEQADHTLFIKQVKHGRKAKDDVQEIEDLKRQLQAEFKLKDIRTFHYFLRIEKARSQ